MKIEIILSNKENANIIENLCPLYLMEESQCLDFANN